MKKENDVFWLSTNFWKDEQVKDVCSVVRNYVGKILLLRIFTRIFAKDDYCYFWTDKEIKFIVDDFNKSAKKDEIVTKEMLDALVAKAIEIDFFDKKAFTEKNILHPNTKVVSRTNDN